MTGHQYIEQGERLRKMRKHLAINQVDLAVLLDTKQSSISHIERGTKGFSRNLLTKIAEVYPEINTSWLLTGKGDMIERMSGNVSQVTIENSQVSPNLSHLYTENSHLTDTLQAAEPETNYERAQTQIHHLLRRINELEPFILKKFPDFKPRR